MTKLLYDARWEGPHGIGRFAQQVSSRLPVTQRLESGPKPASLHDPLWLSWQIMRVRPGVFFSPGFNPPLVSRQPFVFTIHDLIHLKVPAESSRAKILYYDHVIRPATHRATQVLTVSQFSKDQILDWAGLSEDKVMVVGCAVGPEFTPLGLLHQPGYPYVFALLNGKPHKNMLGALEVFARAGLDTNVKLLLSGLPVAAVLERARALRLLDRVVFAGMILESELSAYYRGALVLLFPSLYEGFGLPPLEAMACGTPVVSSNLTSLPEVIADAALSSNPMDVEQMASLLARAVNDTALRLDLRERGLRQASRFDWDDVANCVLKVLKRAMD
jgi:glycosyltransferase involved in cell wall biosynthesis